MTFGDLDGNWKKVVGSSFFFACSWTACDLLSQVEIFNNLSCEVISTLL